MTLATLESHADKLRCPECGARLEASAAETFVCSDATCPRASSPFPTVSGRPALFCFDRSIVTLDHLVNTDGEARDDRAVMSPVARLVRALMHPQNTQARRSVAQMIEMLRANLGSLRPVVLVIGGGSVGSGLDELYASTAVEVIAFDIRASDVVQFLADGHDIPLADESVDGVVVQAVLEHVLEPHVVVAEIYRVLKRDGIVYADSPFLQQVHEGPYDFTRFTDSGHRFLFRRFSRLDSGLVAGAGTQLAWSIDYFVRSLLRSRRAGVLARLAVSWLPWLDRYLDPKYSLDGASSVFFLGRKGTDVMAPHEILDYYQGAQAAS